MTKLIISFLLVLPFAVNAFAIDTSTDTHKQQKIDRDKSLQQKKSIEKGDSIEIKLSIDSIFIPIVAELEKNTKPFNDCKIVNKPKQPADFGLSSQVGADTVDTIKAQYLEQQAKNSSIAPEGIRKYKNCMAFYGALTAQAHKNLLNMMPDTLDIEDMQELARMAIEKVLYDGFDDKNITAIYNTTVNDKTPCRFNGSLNSFRCGMTTLDLVSQKLLFGDVEVYGNKFSGYAGEYKVSSSTRKSKEAILAQKKAWEVAKSGKQAVSPSKLLPNP